MDEWIVFLKTGEIGNDTQAPGLAEARERLKFSSLDKQDRAAYLRNIENLRVQRGVIDTARIEGLEEGRAQGREEGKVEGKAEGKAESRLEIARNMKSLGIATKLIISATGLTGGEIENL